MAAAIGVRSDFSATDLRRFARRCGDPDQVPAAHGVVRWRLIDLAQWVWDEWDCQDFRVWAGG